MASLNTKFFSGSPEQSVSHIDRAIREYIDRNQGSATPYDDLIADDRRWTVFYHLSELRTGVISWYDFKKDSDILEIGAGFGALTGCLCRKGGRVVATERSAFRAESIVKRYQNVNSLLVYAGDVLDIDFEKNFDYILLIGILERQGKGSSDLSVYIHFLEQIKTLLKKDGKLLIAVENRMGLRYFCGAAEPHTGRAFEGLNHYPRGATGYSFTKNELSSILSGAGFPRYKFYYPLPDYKLPQLIYTDAHLPRQDLCERLIPYYVKSSTLVAREDALYRDVTDHGVFPFFANSFLAECTENGQLEDIVYASLSTDRGTAYGFSTVIHGHSSVRKTPLYPQGQKQADQLAANTAALKEKEITVIDSKRMPDGSLELPYVAYPTLSNYLKPLIKNDPSRFLELLDKLCEIILRSSKLSDINDLAACMHSDELAQLTQEDWGPLLETAYIEMIPLNCFYHNETFYFFDQEFIRRNYPARYVMFRAIHYIYCFTPDAQQYIPLESLKARYGLEKIWPYLLREEYRFSREIHRHKTYRQYAHWTAVDQQRILENAVRLEGN